MRAMTAGTGNVRIDLDRGWLARAACVGADPAIFHPERGESAAEAVAICATCPAQADCLEYALAACELHGVWGGKTPKQRQRLRQGRLRICVECGHTYPPGGAHVRYCSDDCHNKARRRQQGLHG